MRLGKLPISLFLIILITLCFSGCKKGSSDILNEANSANIPSVEIQSENESIPETSENENVSIAPDKDSTAEESEDDNIPSASKKLPESGNFNIGKRVVCYGDSLTESYGGGDITMPNTIAALSSATVLNYGVFSESASCIAARQGGNPQSLVEDIIIPADCTPVHAQVGGKYGWEMLLVFGDAGINPCSIGGIEGTYSINDDGERMFTRLEPGEETSVPADTPFLTHAMIDKQPDDIMVVWAGSNDTLESLDDIPVLLQKINEMVKYHGNDQYVIVSLTSRHSRIAIVDDVNKALEAEFKEHYLNLREFMVNDALTQLGITPTEHDMEAIEKGDVPFSIRLSEKEDENHGNPDFYRLAGEQIYKKLVELGYLK